MKKGNLYVPLTLFLPIQIVLVKLISYFPGFVEHYYSNGIYPFISLFFRTIYGWVPFSIGDVLYMLIILSLFIFGYRFINNKSKNRKQQLYLLGAVFSVFYLLFHFFWGMNYHRNSLFKTLQLEQKEYSIEELTKLTDILLLRLKQTQIQLVENDTIIVKIPYSKTEILKKTKFGYKALSKEYPQYVYRAPSIKKSLFSVPLTYMGFSGYFNPFSSEAQVDVLVPKVSLPMVCSHEVAHQLGLASESETNFIGFLAATRNKDDYFKYSGYLTALRYSIGSISYRDSLLAKKYIKMIPKGALKNIEESRNFWKSYQNKAEPFFKLFYDNYLKVNQQKEGIRSYNKMVNLLVAYNEKHGL